MEEPNWDNIPRQLARSARVNDIVWVRKKTRGRFGKMEKAQPGEYGLVISAWMSSMGSLKICFVTTALREVAITDTCVAVIGTIDTMPEWLNVRNRWMEETYVPIIVVREASKSSRSRHPFVKSRNGGAVLVKPLGGKSTLWVNVEKVHPEDWRSMMASSQKCHSLRVPEWVAKKAGIL